METKLRLHGGVLGEAKGFGYNRTQVWILCDVLRHNHPHHFCEPLNVIIVCFLCQPLEQNLDDNINVNTVYIQGDSRKKVNNLEGDSFGHYEKQISLDHVSIYE